MSRPPLDTMRFIHPSQRCIFSRQMTDNIFEIETTALAHVACAPQESGVLLTDFAAAYPSVNHSWIFSVLENTGLPGFLCRFPHVEFAGAERGQFLMARGVRQSCPASGFLFAMAFVLTRSSDGSKRLLSRSTLTTWISCSLHNALTLMTSPLLHPLLESWCMHWHLHSVPWITSLASIWIVANAVGFITATKSMILWGHGSRRIAKSSMTCKLFDTPNMLEQWLALMVTFIVGLHPGKICATRDEN